MKLRSTTPISTSLASRAALVAVSVLMAGAGILHLGSQVFARNYEAEIQAKEQEANKYNSEANRLGEMAESLQAELDKLNGQISAIQGQIADSQKKIEDLNVQIKNNEVLIKQNRKTLGKILADMHIDDQISPLEMLASSSSIGDYLDKQGQRDSMRTSLNSKIKEIKALQKKLDENKKSVEAVLKDQEAQRATLASKQSEKSKLVADTKNDQNTYSALAQKRNSEIASLRAQQAEENLRALRNSGYSGSIPAGTPGGGGYPGVWANAPLDAYVDPWGLYTRECVSYVAWKIHSTGRYVPHFGGAGNANEWPSTAARHGISSGSTPKVGSAAVQYIGRYGHVMYVEAVHGNGMITVSDYNLNWDGLYRKYDRSASGLTYVYF